MDKSSRIPERKVAPGGSGLDKCDVLDIPKAEMQFSEDAQHRGKASCLASSQRDTQTAHPSRLFSTDNRSTDEGKDEYLLKLLNRGKPKTLHHPLPSTHKGFLEPRPSGSRNHSTAMLTDSTINPQANPSGSARTAKFPAYNSTFNTAALPILTEEEEAAAAAVLEKEEGQSPRSRGIRPAGMEEQQGSRPSRPLPTNESPRTRGEEAAAAANDADDESKEQQKKKRKKTHQPANNNNNMFSPVPLPNVAVHGIGAELSFNTTKLRLGKDNAELLRTTVLQHQVTFLDQLYDLHRSIAIQRLLVKSCPEVEGVMSEAVKLLQSGGGSWGGSGGRNNDDSGFLRPVPRWNGAGGGGNGNGETTKRTSSDDLRPDSQFAAVPQVRPEGTATEEADNDDSGKDGNEGGSGNGSGGGSNSPQPLAQQQQQQQQQQHYQPHMYANALQQQLAFPFGALHHPALNLAGPAPSGASAAPPPGMMMHHPAAAAHPFMQAAPPLPYHQGTPQPILPPHMMMMLMPNGRYAPQNNNMGLMWPPTHANGCGSFVPPAAAAAPPPPPPPTTQHPAAAPLDPMAWWYQTYYGGQGNGNVTGAPIQQQQEQEGDDIAQPADMMVGGAGNAPVVVNNSHVNVNANINNCNGNAPPTTTYNNNSNSNNNNNNNNNNLGGIPPTRWWLDPQQTFGPPVDADLLAKLHSQQVAQRVAGEAESAPPGAPACFPPSLFMTAANTLNNNKNLGKLEQQQQMLRQQQQQSFPSGTMTRVGMAGARPMVMTGEQQQQHVDGLQNNTGATPRPPSLKKVSLFSRNANAAGVVVHGEAAPTGGAGGIGGGGRIAATTGALRRAKRRKRKLDDDCDEASSGTTTPAGDHGVTPIYSDLHARLTAATAGNGIFGSDLVRLDKNAANLLLSMSGKITTNNTGTSD
jgi:hypothetical protein